MEFSNSSDVVGDTDLIDSCRVVIRDLSGIRSYVPASNNGFSSEYQYSSDGANSQFVLSPDGSKLAVIEAEETKIFSTDTHQSTIIPIRNISRFSFSPLGTFIVAYCSSSDHADVGSSHDNLFIFRCPVFNLEHRPAELTTLSSFRVTLPSFFPLILSAEEFCGGKSGHISLPIIAWSNSESICIRWHESGLSLYKFTHSLSVYPVNDDIIDHTLVSIRQGRILNFSLSPSGQFLSIISDATTGEYPNGIYMLNLHNNNSVVSYRRLSNSSSSSLLLCTFNWSPDSNHLICITSTPASSSYYSTSIGVLLSSTSECILLPVTNPSYSTTWISNSLLVLMNMDTVVCVNTDGDVMHSFYVDNGSKRRNVALFSHPYLVLGGFGSMAGDVDVWKLTCSKKKKKNGSVEVYCDSSNPFHVPTLIKSYNCHLACNFQICSIQDESLMIMFGIQTPRRLVDNSVACLDLKKDIEFKYLSNSSSVYQTQLVSCKIRGVSIPILQSVDSIQLPKVQQSQQQQEEEYVPPHLRRIREEEKKKVAEVSQSAKPQKSLKASRKRMVELDDEKRAGGLSESRRKEILSEQEELRTAIVLLESRRK